MEPHCLLNNEDNFDICRIIDHIPDIFLLVDDQGTIIRTNAMLENMLGWKPSEIVGSKIEILLEPELHKSHVKMRNQFYANPTTRDMNQLTDLNAFHKKGYVVPVDIKLSFMEIDGKTYGTAIVRDATKQRELEEELKENIQALKKTMEEKNHLLGIAAHDMRNPIGIIHNYAEIMASKTIGELNNDQFEFVNRINQSAIFTLSLLEDMLDFSTIEAGIMNLQKENIKFSEILDEILPANKIHAKNKAIDLRLNTDSLTQQHIFADKRKLHQVLNNLVNNAIKYSPNNSRIDINAAKKGNELIFSVQDRGVGIPKADLDNLFQPFYRARNKPTGGEKSTGLGLFITKRIVEAHNGTLHVNSVDGNGSTFSVALPVIN